jgi:uncharacterized protein (TIGR02117 family)
MPAKILYRIMKLLEIIAEIGLLLIISYLLVALVLSLLPCNPEKFHCVHKKDIYVTTNGVHLDIIIPVKNMDKDLLNKLNPQKESSYFGFGWGDKEFYRETPYWSDLKFNVAFKALFLKSSSAMHVTFYPNSYHRWKKILLCEEQLVSLNGYIKNSFQKNIDGQFILCPFPGYSDFDIFYEANNSFSLFRTCNIWINNALKSAGIKTSVWSPFDFGVLFHLNRNPDIDNTR